MKTRHNPRIDPRPGDVLRALGRVRTFYDGPHGTGEFVRYKIKGDGNRLHQTTIEGWRKWAGNAEIVEV